jgi:hypothetical protein
MRGYLAYVSGKYISKMFIDAGFKIGSEILYSEATYNGEIVYKDVKPAKHFYRDGIPAAYVLYLDYEGEEKKK